MTAWPEEKDLTAKVTIVRYFPIVLGQLKKKD